MVDRVTNSAVEYQVQSDDAGALITGHEVFRFGVPMIGEYDDIRNGSTIARATIKSAVPGAQYRITTWALTSSGRSRSARPAVEHATTGEASEHNYILLLPAGRASLLWCASDGESLPASQ